MEWSEDTPSHAHATFCLHCAALNVVKVGES